MSYVAESYWIPDGQGVTRRDRRGCEYAAYVPDPIADCSFTLDGETAADVADAEAAIVRLNSEATSLVNTEGIARLLLRAEAVASSRIEGLEIGARRLLHAEVAREFGGGSRDVTAEEVLGNIAAMSTALEHADSGERMTVGTILAIHERLLAGTMLSEHAGLVREAQNWIGGSSYNPCSAAFVPPPPKMVPGLLEDLAEFCSSDSLPPLVQAAIAHAQFETIHPFIDGNGRTGRALVHAILRRRGLADRVVPPVSLVLATMASDYVGGLTAYRYMGPAMSEQAVRGVNTWVALFAGACTRSVRDSNDFERRVREIQSEWRERLGTVRRNSTTDKLIEALPGTPIITVNTAVSMLGRSFPAANKAIETLVDRGVLAQVSVGRRNRAFEAPEIIDAFTDFERRLASPVGDTRIAPPSRRVPARRG